MTSEQESVFHQIARLEEQLWISESRFDKKRMEKTFAEDFFEFGRSARVHSRKDCLAHTSGTIDAKLPLPNLKLRFLANNKKLKTVQVRH